MKVGKELLILRDKKDYKEYYEQLDINKLDSLDETDKFLERQKLLKLTQEIENLNRPVTSVLRGLLVITKVPTKRSPGPRGLSGEIYQILKKILKPILYKLFQKMEKGEILHNSF